jgi:hypothetical protein
MRRADVPAVAAPSPGIEPTSDRIGASAEHNDPMFRQGARRKRASLMEGPRSGPARWGFVTKVFLDRGRHQQGLATEVGQTAQEPHFGQDS